MTADERYARFTTLDELNKEYDMNKRSAETLEYMRAIDMAYEKHYERLLREKNG